jgi:formylmethanofuran dehydrogenase subunit B
MHPIPNSPLRDFPCTACGAVCDDLTLIPLGMGFSVETQGCELAREWFERLQHHQPPVARIGEQEVPLPQALDAAAHYLQKSQAPVIYGLSRSTTAGQRSAIQLAEKLGATIDTTAATGHAPSLRAVQEVGESTCTLGEVRQRADLVIYWGCDPVRTHPRHVSRYIDRSRTKIGIVDVQATLSTQIADHVEIIPSGEDWNILQGIRLILKGYSCSIPAAQRLATLIKEHRFIVIFFGGGLVQGVHAHRDVEALLCLVNENNNNKRLYARRLRRFGDVAGADSVLTWQTGFPFSVNFALGYPRYHPVEFNVPEMLERREVDCCLFVGTATAEDFSAQARETLAKIPVLVLDAPHQSSTLSSTVHFTTAVAGWHSMGTAYRMDEVPIPLRPVVQSPYPTDAEVLEGLLQRL